MNTKSGMSEWEGADRLDLHACPICYGEGTLRRHQASMEGTRYVWYECETCRSALLSLGEGVWAYQKIPQSPGSPLVGRAITVAGLHELLRAAAPVIVTSPPSEARQGPVEATPPGPEPVPVAVIQRDALERDATELDMLRASLEMAQVLDPAAMAPDADGERAELPFAFVVAAAVLVVILVAGLGLTLLVMFWPT